MYAPTLRFHDGRFWMITTNVSAKRDGFSGNFLVHSADPRGPWSDPVWIDAMAGIDPDLFWDIDGTCYAQWSWRPKGTGADGIVIGQAALDPLAGRLLEEPRTIWCGTGGLGPEGPHIYRRDGWYWLLIAEGGTEYGHMVTLARSRSARGPYEPCPHNPVLTHRSLGSSIHAVGHADLVEGPDGAWWGVVHGIRPKGYHSYHVLGRETFLFSVSWDGRDGWPELGERGRLPEEPVVIGGRAVEPVSCFFHDNFRGPSWPVEWTWLRNPDPAATVRAGDGRLVLRGNADPLHQSGQTAWVGVRQRHHHLDTTAEVEVDLPWDGGEAGLVAWQNLNAHAVIGVRSRSGVRRVFTRVRSCGLVVEEDGPVLGNEPGGLRLFLRADERHYELGIVMPPQPGGGGRAARLTLQQVQARLLSTEVSGLFTGVFLALYASGAATLTCQDFRMTAPGSEDAGPGPA
jgi:alpha-N-arabinofuranosidase